MATRLQTPGHKTAVVHVLRGEAGSALGQAVRDTMWLLARGQRTEHLLPAGPWQRPHAAVLEYLQQCGSPVTAGIADPTILRAELIRTLTHERVLGFALLDRVDTESIELFAGMAALSDALRAAGEAGGLRIVAGVCTSEPAGAMRSLLHMAAGGVDQVLATTPQGLPVMDRVSLDLLARLAVADAPLPREALQGDSQDTTGLLQRLEAMGLVLIGQRIGHGTTFSRIDFHDHELAEVKRAMRRPAGLVPDTLGAGIQLLHQGEYAAAARLLRPHATAGGISTELAYALALCESGHADAPLAVFEHMLRLRLSPRDELTMGRLAAGLHRLGRVAPEVAESRLRRAERAVRDTDNSAALMLRAVRARLLVTRGHAARATTLLRRVSRDAVMAATRDARLQWHLAMGYVAGSSGNWDGGASAAEQAKMLAVSPAERMQVLQLRRQLATWNLPDHKLPHAAAAALDEDEFVAAAQLLDAQALRAVTRRVSRGQSLRAALARVFPAPRQGDDLPPGSRPDATFRWFAARGATLLAMFHGDALHVFPPEAAARPELVKWLKASLRRMEASPRVQVHDSIGLAAHGWPGADLLLYAQKLGEHGPLLVAARADSDQESLMAAFERAG